MLQFEYMSNVPGKSHGPKQVRIFHSCDFGDCWLRICNVSEVPSKSHGPKQVSKGRAVSWRQLHTCSAVLPCPARPHASLSCQPA